MAASSRAWMIVARQLPVANSLKTIPRTSFRHSLQGHRRPDLLPTVPARTVPARYASQWGPRRLPPQYNRFSGPQQAWYLWTTSGWFRTAVAGSVVIGSTLYYWNLEQVPVSGRWRFNCVSAETEKNLGAEQVQAVLQEYQGRILPSYHPSVIMVQKVLDRLIPAVGAADTQWELRVIDAPEEQNAFVVPGGKVFVFSGILPICGNEDGIATVLGHEIAHSVAHHIGEKLSKSFFVMGAGVILSLFFDISGQLTRFALDYALEKPNSRKMESEADHIGLLIMAQACYDPNTAVGFWHRMAKAEKVSPPQFLSTHPSSGNRVKAIEGWLPEADTKYSASDCSVMGRYGKIGPPVNHRPQFWGIKQIVAYNITQSLNSTKLSDERTKICGETPS